MNTISFDELEARLLANTEVKAAYDALEQDLAETMRSYHPLS
ncbi:MAG: hypothetical protein PHT38_10815 [Halothiobacillus sp.]|nr:hypothetical protein [Halothiobacillus sp.]